MHCTQFSISNKKWFEYLQKDFFRINFYRNSLSTKTNITVDSIYRQPKMDLNCYYLNPLFEKLAKEQKTAFLLSDFNVDLLKYETSDSINSFIDSLSANFLLRLIYLTTRISKTSALIDNIF